MIKNFKVKLKVNNKQRTHLLKCAGVSRFAYNWALEQEKINHEAGNKFISNFDLRKKLTQLKKTDEFSWLFDYDNNITKQAIKDACNSYLSFFKGQSKHPKFHSKKNSRQSFFVDNFCIKIFKDGCKIPKVNYPQLKQGACQFTVRSNLLNSLTIKGYCIPIFSII